MHTHIRVYKAHMCTHTHAHAHAHVHAHAHTRTCARAHMAYVHMRTRAHAPWHMRTRAHAHTRTRAFDKNNTFNTTPFQMAQSNFHSESHSLDKTTIVYLPTASAWPRTVSPLSSATSSWNLWTSSASACPWNSGRGRRLCASLPGRPCCMGRTKRSACGTTQTCGRGTSPSSPTSPSLQSALVAMLSCDTAQARATCQPCSRRSSAI